MKNTIKKEEKESHKLSKFEILVSTVGILFSLLIFYYQEGIIIRTYTYTQKSENRLTDHLHVDSEVIEKFANLKDKKHSPKSNFTFAVNEAYGEALDIEFLNIIIAVAEKKLSFTFNWIILPFLLTIVLASLLWSFIHKRDELISDLEKINKELNEELEKINKELNEELNEKDTKIEKLTKLKNVLCLCNVQNACKTLINTKYSNDSIKKTIEEHDRFYLFGIFADKWIGDIASMEKFKTFLNDFRGSEHRAVNEKIKFLLTDPLDDKIQAVIKTANCEKTPEQYYENYKNLAEFYSDYDDIFECKVVSYFPVFRYRKINNETIVSDYRFAKKIKKGEDRPHLVFEYKKQCEKYVGTEDNKIEPCCSLAAAFDSYFDNCWKDEENAKDLLKYLEDAKK